MLTFHCPFCQTKCETSPEYAGMNMPCPKCGKTITAPGGSGIAAGEPKMAPARSQQTPPPNTPANPAGGNYLLYGIVGIVVVVAIVFVGAMMNNTAIDSGGPGGSATVLMETSMGDVKIELYGGKAPITVANFLKYVDQKHYDGTIFHRVIPGFMAQGGGFLPGMREVGAKQPPIRNEAGNGLSNARGTIAMARTDDPDSATDQFFISVEDNKQSLDRKSGSAGYAVFGKVVSGMDVIDQIVMVPRGKRGHHGDVPNQDILIKSIRRVDEAPKEENKK
jgi:cyclophilin family peptidyl-prolyl cis-trans isomerase